VPHYGFGSFLSLEVKRKITKFIIVAIGSEFVVVSHVSGDSFTSVVHTTELEISFH
jgi:hypothetical protein